MDELTLEAQLEMRGKFLKDLPGILDMAAKPLHDGLADCWHKSYEAIRSYANRERMASDITYSEFVRGLESVVSGYIENVSVDEIKRLKVAEKWERHRDAVLSMAYFLFIDPETTFPLPKGQELAERRFNKLLADMKSLFMLLDPATAYKLKADYDLYSGVTSDDISFVRAITQMDERQKWRLWNYLIEKDGLSAGSILARLKSGEVGRWVFQYSYDFSVKRNSKKRSWEVIEAKARANIFEFFNALFFLDAMWITAGETPTLDEKRFGELEMDLFLLFKYCLASEWKDALMLELRGEL